MTYPGQTMELLAALPVDGGAWGETAADFQRRDAAAVLDPDGPPFTWCGRPRGGRKTADAAGIAVALHLTVAPRGATSYCVAADAAQAGLVLDSVRGFVLRAPALKEHIRVEARRVVFLKEGEPVGWLHVLPADEASAYGLRPWMVIADELSVWPTTARGLWAAVVSALPKVAGSRLIVLTQRRRPRALQPRHPRARPDLDAMERQRGHRTAAMGQRGGARRAEGAADRQPVRPTSLKSLAGQRRPLGHRREPRGRRHPRRAPGVPAWTPLPHGSRPRPNPRRHGVAVAHAELDPTTGPAEPAHRPRPPR